MKILSTILVAGMLLFMQAGTAVGQCSNVILFNLNNDLTHTCVKGYNGSAGQRTCCNGVSSWGFYLSSSSNYIIVGPFAAAGPAEFKYCTNCNESFKIYENATGVASDPWTLVASAAATADGACNAVLTTQMVPSGHYMKITKDACSGGLKYAWIREIQLPGPVPVQLVSFMAGKTANGVKLTWKTSTEINNYGFEIQRDANNEKWSNLGFVAGAGTVNTPQTYTFTDPNPVSPTSVIRYRLRQIDRDGSFEYSPIVTVSLDRSTSFGIMQAFPNPFNPSTTISFNLPVDSKITLKVFDDQGKEVETLINNEFLAAGSYSRSFMGASLNSGAYYAWLYSTMESSVLRIALVK